MYLRTLEIDASCAEIILSKIKQDLNLRYFLNAEIFSCGRLGLAYTFLVALRHFYTYRNLGLHTWLLNRVNVYVNDDEVDNKTLPTGLPWKTFPHILYFLVELVPPGQQKQTIAAKSCPEVHQSTIEHVIYNIWWIALYRYLLCNPKACAMVCNSCLYPHEYQQGISCLLLLTNCIIEMSHTVTFFKLRIFYTETYNVFSTLLSCRLPFWVRQNMT